MSRPFVIIVGGAAGGLAFMVAVTVLWFCLLQCRAFRNRSETSSSASPRPSTLVAWVRRDRTYSASSCPTREHKGCRKFALEELEQATNNFSENNFVGIGSFGMVYKGLLLDGTVVAIKRLQGNPQHGFVEEVKTISAIWHRNLVTLIGYCQEDGLQILVFEYLPNGSISSHLFGTRENSTKLEFKQRLSVAIGAAKGLTHLHNLVPPSLHRGFKTSNVLVDENFIAKVADAGIMKLLQRIENVPRPSSIRNVFEAPEKGRVELLSESSDVYSFGVFLLELMSGQEVAHLACLASYESLAKLVEAHVDSNKLIDSRLGSSYTGEGMKGLIRLTLRCLDPSEKGRPDMGSITRELLRILETEMALTTVMGDCTAEVTLGSQLFTA